MEMKEKSLLRSCTMDEDTQHLLLKYIKENDSVQLKNLLEEGRLDINFKYDYPYYKTALQIACFEFARETSEECVQFLLDYGANAFYCHTNSKKQAINFAAEGGNPEILRTILRHFDKSNINFVDSNAILTLIQYIKEDEQTEEDFIQVLEILLDTNIDINIPDIESGWTAIYMAAKYKFKHIITTILHAKGAGVNLDSFKDRRGKTARDIIKEEELFSGELPDHFDENSNITIHTLYQNIREQKTEDFKTNYDNFQNNLSNDEQSSLLFNAVDNNLEEIVKCLLQNGADASIIPTKYNENPLQLACKRGYHKIVKALLNTNPNSELVSKALIDLVKSSNTPEATETIDHKKCLEMLLKNKNLKINSKYWNENTALHYAVRYQNLEITLQILRNGASLACKDSFDKLPIADMSADVLKSHLDECITYPNEECSKEDRNACLKINFTSLLPPRSNTVHEEVNLKPELKQENHNENSLKLELEQESLVTQFDELQSETAVLEHMCSSRELKQLLTHPVILTFLYLKWHRIRMFFYINLAIYTMFITSLMLYITLRYNQKSELQFITGLCYTILTLTFILLLLRECAQIIIFRYRYFLSFDNWLEMILLIVTALILLQQTNETTTRQFSAVAIVVSATEFLLLVGQLPSLSTNIMMLRTVSYTFFKLLLWYSILLFAFAYSFYTLFQETEETKTENTSDSTPEKPDEDEEQDFFLDPGMSLLKTIVMLTGEFDAGSIKFNSYPVISHIIFVMFVFLITIVLFNLLNGLAVSDTQMIKNDAELYGQILRVEHVAHVERVLLTNKIMQWLPAVKRICLFPVNVTHTYIQVYPNLNSKVIFPETQDTEQTQCYGSCFDIHLDKKLQRAITTLMQEVKQEDNKKSKDDDVKKQLYAMKNQLDKLQALIMKNSLKV